MLSKKSFEDIVNRGSNLKISKEILSSEANLFLNNYEDIDLYNKKYVSWGWWEVISRRIQASNSQSLENPALDSRGSDKPFITRETKKW